MQRFLLILIASICLPIFGFSQDFVVHKAQIDIDISEEGFFDVIENYDVEFLMPKHGIYRFIQTKYDLLNEHNENESRKIKIRNIKVPGHKADIDFDFVQDLNDMLEIKIGNPNKTVSGHQHYEIKYRVYNAFLFEENNTSFYWNVKASNWEAPFNAIEFNIQFPKNASIDPGNIFIYSGWVGTNSLSEEFETSFHNHSFTATSKPGVISQSGMSVTTLIKFPPGLIQPYQPPFPFLSRYGWLFLPGLMIAFFYFIWNKFGKDDKVVTAITYFPPGDIDPAMAGFLIDDKAHTRDLISFIPHWGASGLLKIEEIPKSGWFGSKDTKIIKIQDIPDTARNYEKTMFNELFNLATDDEIMVSELKNVFYTTINSAKTMLSKSAQKYYDRTARRVMYFTIAGIFIAGTIAFFIQLYFWNLFVALAIIPVMILLFILSPHIVKKNSKGNEALSELKGFKQFIAVAEENQLKMLLAENPTYFEKTMAYAVAFGMFDSWAKKFEVLNLQPPTWYSSPAGIYSMSSFSKSFSSAISSAQTQMVSSPSSSSSSSGGGSSGGGFGGGGGGSW